MENFIFHFILLEMKAKRELNFELYVCHEIFVRLEIQTLMILQNMPIFQHKWSCANLSFIFRYSWTFCFEKNTTLVWITWLSLKCKACNNCKCNSLKSFFSLITTRYTQNNKFRRTFFWQTVNFFEGRPEGLRLCRIGSSELREALSPFDHIYFNRFWALSSIYHSESYWEFRVNRIIQWLKPKYVQCFQKEY